MGIEQCSRWSYILLCTLILCYSLCFISHPIWRIAWQLQLHYFTLAILFSDSLQRYHYWRLQLTTVLVHSLGILGYIADIKLIEVEAEVDQNLKSLSTIFTANTMQTRSRQCMVGPMPYKMLHILLAAEHAQCSDIALASYRGFRESCKTNFIAHDHMHCPFKFLSMRNYFLQDYPKPQ